MKKQELTKILNDLGVNISSDKIRLSKVFSSVVTADHFKVGEKVQCLRSGRVGKVIEIKNEDSDNEIYVIERMDGLKSEHRPTELRPIIESVGDKSIKELEKEAKSLEDWINRYQDNDDMATDIEKMKEKLDGVYEKIDSLKSIAKALGKLSAIKAAAKNPTILINEEENAIKYNISIVINGDYSGVTEDDMDKIDDLGTHLEQVIHDELVNTQVIENCMVNYDSFTITDKTKSITLHFNIAMSLKISEIITPYRERKIINAIDDLKRKLSLASVSTAQKLEFKLEKDWLKQADYMGFKIIKNLTDYDGNPAATHKAKDKQGNDVGEFDLVSKKGWLGNAPNKKVKAAKMSKYDMSILEKANQEMNHAFDIIEKTLNNMQHMESLPKGLLRSIISLVEGRKRYIPKIPSFNPLKLQDKIVDYVNKLAKRAGVQISFDNSNFDGEKLYLSFSPEDLIKADDYGWENLNDDVEKMLGNKYNVIVNYGDGSIHLFVHENHEKTKTKASLCEWEDDDEGAYAGETYDGTRLDLFRRSNKWEFGLQTHESDVIIEGEASRNKTIDVMKKSRRPAK